MLVGALLANTNIEMLKSGNNNMTLLVNKALETSNIHIT